MAPRVTIHNPIHKFTALDDFQVLLRLGMRLALPASHRGHPACRGSWLCGYRCASACPEPSSDRPSLCSQAMCLSYDGGCEDRSVALSQERPQRWLPLAADDLVRMS